MLEGTGSVGLPDDSQIRNVCQALARLYSARVPSSSDQGVSVNAHSQILLALRLLASHELVTLLNAHKAQILTILYACAMPNDHELVCTQQKVTHNADMSQQADHIHSIH